jgi:hypothetical protein
MKEDDFDLTNESIYDKQEGPLYPLSLFILYNVFIHPAFPLEFYHVAKPYNAVLDDKTSLTIPGGAIVVVNHKSCNLSNRDMNKKKFSAGLSDTKTLMSFIVKKNGASFGGSPGDKNSRTCPGRRMAMLEQEIMLSVLLRYFTVTTEGISCAVNSHEFPLDCREKRGNIVLKKSPRFFDKEQSDRHARLGTPSHLTSGAVMPAQAAGNHL